jgi:hypothetical protein
MGTVDMFWKLGAHSDRELLEGLKVRVGSGRQLMAEVLAHLGEVEERRLHLEAGYGSMFAYCVSRLGMSEDEACRRIDVARLARRHPALFPRLAIGQLSLSVAALLKPYLAAERASADLAVSGRVSAGRPIGDVEVLLAAVCGKTVQQAREALVKLFPIPDVEPSIRKLPDRGRAAGATSARLDSVANVRAATLQASTPQPGTPDADSGGTDSNAGKRDRTTSSDWVARSVEGVASPSMVSPSMLSSLDGMASQLPGVVVHAPSVGGPANPVRPANFATGSPAHHGGATRCEQASVAAEAPQPFVLETPRAERIEPLSPGRYRVQFTADAALKEKLELARDLMRHTLPRGDLAAIVERSLDLLIEQLMKRRFGALSRRHQPPHGPARPSRGGQQRGNANPPTNAESPTSTEQGGNANRPANAESPTSAEQATNAGSPTSTEQGRNAKRPTNAEPPTSVGPLAPETHSEAISRELGITRGAAPTTRRRERFNGADAAPLADSPSTDPTAPRFDRATRRAVLERDGLRCSWRSADGVRCEARAWLELDHIRPRARGGSSCASNGRLLCRAHNHLAAEQEFGRQHIEQAIAKQRGTRRPIRSEP